MARSTSTSRTGHRPTKTRLWGRGKTASATGLAGLVLGFALAGGGSGTSSADESPAETPGASDAEVAQAVAEETATLHDQLAAAEERLTEAGEEAAADLAAAVATAEERALKAQRRAVRQAVARVRDEERRKLEQAVQEARDEAASGGVTPFAGGGSDPLFDTCGEANAAGFGHYVSGVDPEYTHYDDRDGDGVVCE
ncbi:excalibur calcium-binding domain-containing protein [Nocardioides sp. SYSU D00038]|uniref:excalibur calcium-binding domain-containing protein n=1 Tax=Nocardioides sp. SYSU D00038 TaxID=2812554 RepID=UPI0019689CDB|nr:excalibur calcium-binding domain-containing protein [Nocardioides sp. SYSU D00038]